MGVLALLAVFTGESTARDGPAFAVIYSAYLFMLGWLWYSVRRQDDPAFRPATTPYIAGVLVSATVVGASALLPDGARLAAWALVVVGWIAGITVLDWRSGATRTPAPTRASR
jgi:low temperature requirement protein LtrA